MPISIVTRIKGKSRGLGSGAFPSYSPTAGTQTCKKLLKITSKSTVLLDPSVFDVEGVFTLFTYNLLYVDSGKTAQQHISTYLEVDDSLLTRVQVLGAKTGTVDELNKTIKVTLVPRA